MGPWLPCPAFPSARSRPGSFARAHGFESYNLYKYLSVRDLLFVSFPRRPTSRAIASMPRPHWGKRPSRFRALRRLGEFRVSMASRMECERSSRLYFFPAPSSRVLHSPGNSRKLAGREKKVPPAAWKTLCWRAKSIASLSLVVFWRERRASFFFFGKRATRGERSQRFPLRPFRGKGRARFRGGDRRAWRRDKKGERNRDFDTSERRATVRARATERESARKHHRPKQEGPTTTKERRKER